MGEKEEEEEENQKEGGGFLERERERAVALRTEEAREREETEKAGIDPEGQKRQLRGFLFRPSEIWPAARSSRQTDT